MNKANTTQKNTPPKKISLEFGNMLIYFTCGIFIVMVFCIITITGTVPAKALPCYNALNDQYSICYAEYTAQSQTTPSSVSTSSAFQAPIKIAQAPANQINQNDFIAPAQSSVKAVEPTPDPIPTPAPVPTPTPVEKPKPVSNPTPVQSPPNQPVETQKPPSSQSSSSESSQPQSSQSQSTSSSSESTQEFGLGQTAVASINQSKPLPNKEDGNSWVRLIVQNWIYILGVIVTLLLGILIYTIIRQFQKKANQETPPTQAPSEYSIPDLNELTDRLNNMPPEVELSQIPEFQSEFETSSIPTFGSDELGFGTITDTITNNNHPFEPIENLVPAPNNFSSLIQERLKTSQIPKITQAPLIQAIDPYKAALNNQFWSEYNQAISSKKSKPFPITNKDRIFFAYCLAYTTVKVYVIDWDLWGE